MDSEAYGGHVDPGGRAISRTVEVDGTSVEIRKFSVSGMDNNVYVLRDLASERALLIDAADDAPRILEELGSLAVEAIITTHGHWDHHRALTEVAEGTGAALVHHPDDEATMPRPADTPAEDGLRVTFGGASVELLHTPGHTPGSICVLLGGRHLFTGDTPFPGSPGRVTCPANFRHVMTTLDTERFTLPGDTWIYPGTR